MATRIGLIGGFQEGKSTLINCLLEDRVAVTGTGLSTTKHVVEYYYSPHIRTSVVRNNVETNLPLKQFMHVETSEPNDLYRIGLPSALLKSITLLDTPGFNADEQDNQTAQTSFAGIDFCIYLLGGTKGMLNTSERRVLSEIAECRIPVLLVFNSHGNTDDQWDPLSAENWFLRKSISSDLSKMGLMRCIPLCGENVFAVNTAWYWYAVSTQRDRVFLLPEAKGEKLLKRSVRNYFSEEDDIPGDQLMERSRIGILREFLTAGGAMFGNVHTTTAIYKAFDDMCTGTVSSMESICRRSARTSERFIY